MLRNLLFFDNFLSCHSQKFKQKKIQNSKNLSPTSPPMKTAKHFTNPTEFFFHQSLNPPTEYRSQINEFVNKLVDLKKCVLCKSLYDMENHVPRILIHCGHTFCTPCLTDFFKNFRVRCPLCLKLIKNIESIERLPINHSIFSILADEINAKKPKGKEDIDLKSILLAQFTQNKAEQAAVPEKEEPKINNFVGDNQIDGNLNPALRTLPNDKPDEELDYCELHNDRVKHFYCLKHKSLTCRVCTEQKHANEGCAIVDLYEVDDIPEFLNQANKYNEDGKFLDNANDKESDEKDGENHVKQDGEHSDHDDENNEDLFEDEGKK